MNNVEKIIANHLVDGKRTVVAGEMVQVEIDRVYVQDGNAPTVARLFREHGLKEVWDSSKIDFVFDHSVVTPNVEMANRLKEGYSFARAMGIQVHRRGSGISHVLAAENGWFVKDGIVLGSDSHTCIGGAFNCLGLGMGASDIVAAMVTGETWLKVPSTIRVMLRGAPADSARARDVVIALLRRYGQERFLYRSIEFHGKWIECLGDDERASFASLGVELGAKCVFLNENEITLNPGDIEFDITRLEPQVSLPPLPANSVDLAGAEGTRIQYAFIGSCTNGRLTDIEEAASVVAGRQVAEGVQLVVTPASMSIYNEAATAGYIQTLTTAGAIITPPGCGTCVGTQGPIPADGDIVLSTMNRNFRGRMGNSNANIYLASPRVVAESAISGFIAEPVCE